MAPPCLQPERFRPLDDPEGEDVSEGDHEVVVGGERPRGRLADLLAVEEQPHEDLRLRGRLPPAQLQVVLHRGGLERYI